MNKCIFSGRLTADAIVKYLDDGKALANFSIAVDRNYKTKDGEKITDFFPCVIWGKGAEVLGNYTQKGDMLILCGSMQNRTYEKDGVKKYITELHVDNFDFCGNKKKTADAEAMNTNAAENGFNAMGEEIPF